jgi:VCBS repeat-containing protein
LVAGMSSEIFGISVADTDSGTLTVTLTPDQGTVSVTEFGTATVTALSGDRVQITGSTADINKVLTSLEFTAEKDITGASLRITTSDGDTSTDDDSDLLSIDVLSSPVNTVTASQTVVAGLPQPVEGISVDDFDTAEIQVTLVPTNGDIFVEAAGSVTLTRPSDKVLRLFGTIADVNASLVSLTFTGTPGATDGSIQVLTTDLDARTPDPTSVISFTILNSPTLELPNQPSVVAGSTALLSRISVADADDGSLTVTLNPTGGTLAAQAAAGATVAIGSDGTLRITGTVTSVNDTLAVLSFTADQGITGAAIILRVADGDARTTDAEATLAIAVASPAELQFPVTTPVLTAGTATALSGIALSDAGTGLVTVRLTATNGTLGLSAQGDVAFADLGNGVFTLIGISGDISATLAATTFSGTPGATSASLRIEVDFTDAKLADLDRTLTIVLVNPPILTTPAAGSIVATAGEAIAVTGISISDFDDASLTVSVSPTGGTVAMAAVGGATVTPGAGGLLTVSGAKADVNATLAGLILTPAAGVTHASLALNASDGDPLSPDTTVSLDIIVVSPAHLTVPATATVFAGTPVELHGINVSDTDSATISVVLVPTGGAIAATRSGSATITTGSGGQLTLSGSPTDVTATLDTLTFTLTTGTPTTGAAAPSLSVAVSDGDARRADPSAVITLTVSTALPPKAGGDIAATRTDGTALSVEEDSAAPVSANIRLAPAITANGDGHSPDAVRILSISGGTLTRADGTAFDLGAAGTMLTLNSGVLDLRFTPDAGRDTAATLRYVMVDTVHGTPNSPAASAAIAISAVNDAPVAVADTAALGQNATLSVAAATGLLANDRDVDTGDTLAVSAVNGVPEAVGRLALLPSGAKLTVNADGSYAYDPSGAFASLAVGVTGTDSFTYTVRDLAGATATATVMLTVTGANDAPVAIADTLSVAADERLTGAASGVLANDFDPDTGDTIRVAEVNGAADAVGRQITLPSEALLRLNADGSYAYDPNGRYDGLAAGVTATDSFSYTMRDGSGATASAIVTVTIRGVNDAPVATADNATLNENGVLNVSGRGVLVNDTDIDIDDSLNVTEVNGQTGSLGQTILLSSGATLLVNTEGSYRYDTNGAFEKLAQGQSRIDSFTYKATDSVGAAATATVRLIITGVNDAPLAGADTVAVLASQVVTVDAASGLLANDTDIDEGDRPQRVSAVNGAAAGVGGIVQLKSGAKLTVASDGSYVYDPDGVFGSLAAGVTATDSFSYTVVDGFGGTATGQVTITITGVNDAPVAVADAATVAQDAVLSVPRLGVLANDREIDQGDSLTVTAVNGAAASVGQRIPLASGATLTLNADASYVYDPNGAFGSLAAGQSAMDSFTYTTADISGAISSATVTITITGLNDGPVVVADTATLGQNDKALVSAAAGVLANDGDVDDSSALSVIAVNGQSSSVGTAISLASGARITLNADGSYVYDTNGAFAALVIGQRTTDTISYTTGDGAGGSAVTTLTLTIVGVNDTPVAATDTATVAENAVLMATSASGLLSNDSDPDQGTSLTVSAVNGDRTAVGSTIVLPSGANLMVGADGSYRYDPDGRFDDLAAGQSRTGKFSYTISDGAGGTATATLTVTITGCNSAPVAVADAASVTQDAMLVVPARGVLANDTDVDSGASLTVVAVDGSAASVGTAITLKSGAQVTLKADGSYSVDTKGRYDRLAVGETVAETLGYTVSDGQGATAAGQVTITIVGTNDAPALAGSLAAQGARETGTFSFKLPADLFTDVDTSDRLTLSADLTTGVALPAWLKFDAAAGTFSRTPGSTDAGAITVRVTAIDSAGASVSTSFTLTIQQAPRAVTPAAPTATVPANTSAAPGLIILPVVTSTSMLSSAPLISSIRAETTPMAGLIPSTAPVKASGAAFGTSETAAFNSIIPASQSWMVQVGTTDETGAASGLRVLNPVTDQSFGADAGISFRLPSGVFVHTDPKAVVTIKATLADGTALPHWLKFNPASGTFSGTPPNGGRGTLNIRITARDDAGAQAIVTFKLVVNRDPVSPEAEPAPEGRQRTDTDPAHGGNAKRQATAAPLPGRPSLSAQLKAASRDDLMTESLALLDSLLKAAAVAFS